MQTKLDTKKIMIHGLGVLGAIYAGSALLGLIQTLTAAGDTRQHGNGQRRLLEGCSKFMITALGIGILVTDRGNRILDQVAERGRRFVEQRIEAYAVQENEE